MHFFDLYIDGASHGNPGKAGIGVVVIDSDGNIIKKISKAIGETTNNIAEYIALIYGLQEALILKVSYVNVYSDSELLVNQIKGTFKVKDLKLRLFWGICQHLIDAFKKMNIEYIPRKNNDLADTLAFNSITT